MKEEDKEDFYKTQFLIPIQKLGEFHEELDIDKINNN